MDPLLVNLASGALGVLVGAFAAYRLQIRESQKLAKGAARAVYVELQTNLVTLQSSSPGGHNLGAFTRDTWQSEQARLGTFLSAVDFMKVAYAYALFPNGETSLEAIRRGGDADFSEAIAMINVVARSVAEAMAVMNPLVLSPSERERVLQIAAELRKESKWHGPPVSASGRRVSGHATLAVTAYPTLTSWAVAVTRNASSRRSGPVSEPA